jgi:flagellar hook protein FlgE
MSISGMMRTGISGMNAQANRLSTVADNMANADTTGYKRASVEFSSLTLPDSNGSYNSGGLKTDVRYAVDRSGPLEFTNSASDLAVDGKGFFVVENANGERFLTRAGSFVPDGNGFLVNAAGFRLLGVPGDGNAPLLANGLDDLVPIQVGAGEARAVATTAGNFAANLPVGDEVGDPARASSFVIYNAVGEKSFVNLSFQKTGDNAWTLNVIDRDTLAPLGTQALTFDPTTGGLTTTPLVMQFDGPDGTPIDLDLSGMTELAYGFEMGQTGMNGSAPSKVDSLNFAPDGRVQFQYENGSIATGYRIALASVISPDRLQALPGNVYKESRESGGYQLEYPQNGSFGQIISGAREGSNVDIAEELTTMIQSQRSYTANSKVFQTGSDLLDILVNLKR